MEHDQETLLKCETEESQQWWTAGKKAVAGLLFVQMMERIAYYVIVGNMFTFASLYLDFNTKVATALPTVFTGSVYVLSPLFGWLADRKAGYYLVLLLALMTEIVGSMPVWFSGFKIDNYNMTQYNATQQNMQSQDRQVFLKGMYAGGLAVVILGASAFRATMIPFMLEQLADGSENTRTISVFCSWSYAAINVGASIGYGVGGYLQTLPGLSDHRSGQCLHSTGFTWSYLLAPSSLLVAVVALVLQRRRFKHTVIQGRLGYTPNFKSILLKSCGCITKDQGPSHYDRSRLPQIEPTGAPEQEKLIREEHENRLAVLIPVLSAFLIFHMVYIQTVTTFIQQGSHMDLVLDLATTDAPKGHANNSCGPNFHVPVLPASSVNVFNTIAVLLVIPLVTCVIRPVYGHCRGKEMTMLTRIRWGIVFSIVACICAVVVEVERLRCCELRAVYIHSGTVSDLIIYSHLSFLSQIPQYAFVGVAEVLGNIAAIEFVLSRSPRELRCTAYGVYNFVLGLGDFIGEVLVAIAQESRCYYIPVRQVYEQLSDTELDSYIEENRNSRAYVYFVLLSGLAIINLCMYIWLEYRHKDVLRQERYRAQSLLVSVTAARSLSSSDSNG